MTCKIYNFYDYKKETEKKSTMDKVAELVKNWEEYQERLRQQRSSLLRDRMKIISKGEIL